MKIRSFRKEKLGRLPVLSLVLTPVLSLVLTPIPQVLLGMPTLQAKALMSVPTELILIELPSRVISPISSVIANITLETKYLTINCNYPPPPQTSTFVISWRWNACIVEGLPPKDCSWRTKTSSLRPRMLFPAGV